MLVHLVDLDSEAHDNAPFTPEALAIMEYTDELLGNILNDLPANYAVVVVSDHGFEKIDRVVNLNVIAAQRSVRGIRSQGGIAVAEDGDAGKFLLELKSDPQYGIGRQIPKEELQRFAPTLSSAAAVFEPVAGFWFGTTDSTELFSKPAEAGQHGHWPSRYRAVYLARGSGIRPTRLPEISMTEIVQRLASLLGVSFTALPAQGR